MKMTNITRYFDKILILNVLFLSMPKFKPLTLLKINITCILPLEKVILNRKSQAD